MKKMTIITGILWLSCHGSFSQEFKVADTRTEKLITNDSVVYCSVYMLTPTVKPTAGRFYFWFDSKRVHWNQGAWHGRLLHGPYRVLLSGGQLSRAGQHEHGLKSGEWKEWWGNGAIKSIERWREGELHGKALYMIDDSTTISKRFKHGVVQRVDTTGRKIVTLPAGKKSKKRFPWTLRRRLPETR
jgi:hypothetical protein